MTSKKNNSEYILETVVKSEPIEVVDEFAHLVSIKTEVFNVPELVSNKPNTVAEIETVLCDNIKKETEDLNLENSCDPLGEFSGKINFNLESNTQENEASKSESDMFYTSMEIKQEDSVHSDSTVILNDDTIIDSIESGEMNVSNKSSSSFNSLEKKPCKNSKQQVTKSVGKKLVKTNVNSKYINLQLKKYKEFLIQQQLKRANRRKEVLKRSQKKEKDENSESVESVNNSAVNVGEIIIESKPFEEFTKTESQKQDKNLSKEIISSPSVALIESEGNNDEQCLLEKNTDPAEELGDENKNNQPILVKKKRSRRGQGALKRYQQRRKNLYHITRLLAGEEEESISIENSQISSDNINIGKETKSENLVSTQENVDINQSVDKNIALNNTSQYTVSNKENNDFQVTETRKTTHENIINFQPAKIENEKITSKLNENVPESSAVLKQFSPVSGAGEEKCRRRRGTRSRQRYRARRLELYKQRLYEESKNLTDKDLENVAAIEKIVTDYQNFPEIEKIIIKHENVIDDNQKRQTANQEVNSGSTDITVPEKNLVTKICVKTDLFYPDSKDNVSTNLLPEVPIKPEPSSAVQEATKNHDNDEENSKNKYIKSRERRFYLSEWGHQIYKYSETLYNEYFSLEIVKKEKVDDFKKNLQDNSRNHDSAKEKPVTTESNDNFKSTEIKQEQECLEPTQKIKEENLEDKSKNEETEKEPGELSEDDEPTMELEHDEESEHEKLCNKKRAAEIAQEIRSACKDIMESENEIVKILQKEYLAFKTKHEEQKTILKFGREETQKRSYEQGKRLADLTVFNINEQKISRIAAQNLEDFCRDTIKNLFTKNFMLYKIYLKLKEEGIEKSSASQLDASERIVTTEMENKIKKKNILNQLEEQKNRLIEDIKTLTSSQNVEQNIKIKVDEETNKQNKNDENISEIHDRNEETGLVLKSEEDNKSDLSQNAPVITEVKGGKRPGINFRKKLGEIKAKQQELELLEKKIKIITSLPVRFARYIEKDLEIEKQNPNYHPFIETNIKKTSGPEYNNNKSVKRPLMGVCPVPKRPCLPQPTSAYSHNNKDVNRPLLRVCPVPNRPGLPQPTSTTPGYNNKVVKTALLGIRPIPNRPGLPQPTSTLGYNNKEVKTPFLGVHSVANRPYLPQPTSSSGHNNKGMKRPLLGVCPVPKRPCLPQPTSTSQPPTRNEIINALNLINTVQNVTNILEATSAVAGPSMTNQEVQLSSNNDHSRFFHNSSSRSVNFERHPELVDPRVNSQALTYKQIFTEKQSTSTSDSLNIIQLRYDQDETRQDNIQKVEEKQSPNEPDVNKRTDRGQKPSTSTSRINDNTSSRSDRYRRSRERSRERYDRYRDRNRSRRTETYRNDRRSYRSPERRSYSSNKYSSRNEHSLKYNSREYSKTDKTDSKTTEKSNKLKSPLNESSKTDSKSCDTTDKLSSSKNSNKTASNKSSSLQNENTKTTAKSAERTNSVKQISSKSESCKTDLNDKSNSSKRDDKDTLKTNQNINRDSRLSTEKQPEKVINKNTSKERSQNYGKCIEIVRSNRNKITGKQSNNDKIRTRKNSKSKQMRGRENSSSCAPSIYESGQEPNIPHLHTIDYMNTTQMNHFQANQQMGQPEMHGPLDPSQFGSMMPPYMNQPMGPYFSQPMHVGMNQTTAPQIYQPMPPYYSVQQIAEPNYRQPTPSTSFAPPPSVSTPIPHCPPPPIISQTIPPNKSQSGQSNKKILINLLPKSKPEVKLEATNVHQVFNTELHKVQNSPNEPIESVSEPVSKTHLPKKAPQILPIKFQPGTKCAYGNQTKWDISKPPETSVKKPNAANVSSSTSMPPENFFSSQITQLKSQVHLGQTLIKTLPQDLPRATSYHGQTKPSSLSNTHSVFGGRSQSHAKPSEDIPNYFADDDYLSDVRRTRWDEAGNADDEREEEMLDFI